MTILLDNLRNAVLLRNNCELALLEWRDWLHCQTLLVKPVSRCTIMFVGHITIYECQDAASWQAHFRGWNATREPQSWSRHSPANSDCWTSIFGSDFTYVRPQPIDAASVGCGQMAVWLWVGRFMGSQHPNFHIASGQ